MRGIRNFTNLPLNSPQGAGIYFTIAFRPFKQETESWNIWCDSTEHDYSKGPIKTTRVLSIIFTILRVADGDSSLKQPCQGLWGKTWHNKAIIACSNFIASYIFDQFQTKNLTKGHCKHFLRQINALLTKTRSKYFLSSLHCICLCLHQQFVFCVYSKNGEPWRVKTWVPNKNLP